MSWICVNKNSSTWEYCRCLENFLKTSLRRFCKRLGKTSWRHLEDVWPRQIYHLHQDECLLGLLVQLKEHHSGLKPSNKHWAWAFRYDTRKERKLQHWPRILESSLTSLHWLTCWKRLLRRYRVDKESYVVRWVVLVWIQIWMDTIWKGKKWIFFEYDFLTMLTYSSSEISTTFLGFSKADDSIFNNSCLKDFWALEAVRIKDSSTKTDDDKALLCIYRPKPNRYCIRRLYC